MVTNNLLCFNEKYVSWWETKPGINTEGAHKQWASSRRVSKTQPLSFFFLSFLFFLRKCVRCNPSLLLRGTLHFCSGFSERQEKRDEEEEGGERN